MYIFLDFFRGVVILFFSNNQGTRLCFAQKNTYNSLPCATTTKKNMAVQPRTSFGNSTRIRSEPLKKKSAFGKPSLRCIEDLGSVNPSDGCEHACIYCYARWFPPRGVTSCDANVPVDQVAVCDSLPELMAEQLDSQKRLAPDRLYYSTTCDAFQPSDRIQTATLGSMQEALTRGKEVAFLTKGTIRSDVMDLLTRNATSVYAQIGIITINPELCALFEPRAAPPNVRIEQCTRLATSGAHVAARMDPVIPGVTDTDEELRALFSCLSSAGVHQVAASYLFMRPNIKEHMAQMDNPLVNSVLRKYESCESRTLQGSSRILVLPREYREAGYTRMITIAKEYDIYVSVCACKNSDIEFSRCCEIAGPMRKRKACDAEHTTATRKRHMFQTTLHPQKS